MSVEEIKKEINKLNSDKDKWTWVLNHKDLKPRVFIDNDFTEVIIDTYEDEYLSINFDSYIGNGYGLYDLFESLGIEVESA